MRDRLVDRSSELPIAIEAAIDHCRAASDESQAVERALSAAVAMIAEMTGRTLREETRVLKITCAKGPVIFPVYPVTEIVAVLADGADVTAAFDLDDDGDRAAIEGPWPLSSVAITYKAGGVMPDDLATAVLMLTCEFYDRRSGLGEAAASELPFAVADIVSLHRRRWAAS